MKFRVTTNTNGYTTNTTVEAEDYGYDAEGLTLHDAEGQGVASFAAGSWVAIEKLPENEAVDFARDR